MTDDTLRVDVLLHRLRLTRSRSEAKAACEVGAVRVGDHVARASQAVGPGQRIAVQYPKRLLEVEVLTLPPKSLSRQGARDLYRVVRDEDLDPDD
jgi:ribosomal 50S subunit-recycling heat shock protein